MKFYRKDLENSGMQEGVLLALFPVLMLLPFPGGNESPPLWKFLASGGASICCLLCALTLYRRVLAGKIFGMVCLVLSLSVLYPYARTNPFVALTGTLIAIGCAFALFDLRTNRFYLRKIPSERLAGQRVLGAALFTLLFLPFSLIALPEDDQYLRSAMMISMGSVTQILFGMWTHQTVRGYWKIPVYAWIVFSISALIEFSIRFHHQELTLLFTFLPILAFSSQLTRGMKDRGHWWSVLLDHPSRLLFSTFFLLCAGGTFLLSIPGTATKDIPVIDAAFTAVSAVCVTGLVVLDTAKDFTPAGQFCIILLIQLGGLGIMSITAAAVYAAGKRLSLNQEQIVFEMTRQEGGHVDLKQILTGILKYTFFMEISGGIILTLLLRSNGHAWNNAVTEGFFTAVSAFCNAGFSLQSNNLAAYSGNAAILNTTGFLIVAGGIAPGIAVMLPAWIKRKKIPLSASIVFITTFVLIATGTLVMLLFEWNGVLKGFDFVGKFNNALFQSITLRTAGFNSVDIAQISFPTFFMMIFMMFVGGSPGGTAGGIKTPVLALTALTFWNSLTGQKENICSGKRIPPETLSKAVTIVFSYAAFLSAAVLMLAITQGITPERLIFEATSAIGTVGLSMNTTTNLDEVGRVLIMATMFAGRVGPMTLFMLTFDGKEDSRVRYPDENLQLT